jgi:RNA polymerase sigma-70 factor, ECF subfamily
MTALGGPSTQTMNEDPDLTRRFRDATLPHLDAVYTLARYLLREPADAEDAVQECYLRALRGFNALRSAEAKPWLFAILRNVCWNEFERRSRVLPYDFSVEPDQPEAATPLWTDVEVSPEAEMLRKLDEETIRGLVAALPAAFREVIVLREVNELSYREIAAVVDAPIGTVMSRLARARAMLRKAWLEAEPNEEQPGEDEAALTRAETRARGNGNAVIRQNAPDNAAKPGLYSRTSSASATKFSGNSIPVAFATLRLMTSL